jgi:hypothetical protein
VNSLGGKQIIQEDYARDLDHPGPMTNKKITEYILENL